MNEEWELMGIAAKAVAAVAATTATNDNDSPRFLFENTKMNYISLFVEVEKNSIRDVILV